eukprot:370928-Rhodomonas_salina.1
MLSKTDEAIAHLVGSRICLRACYALPGTDVEYGVLRLYQATHPHFADTMSYLNRFRQVQARALAIIKSEVASRWVVCV